ncbi:hypothetical protein [Ruegeria sp. HKCCD8929]|uniref:hypothetical protein n=1 Tax=Ruegeria sp. HKCCD8929 TaxID=2683006 RepID=UPI0014887557|nr:hypothetical protein [Ruegeria sp. HKCCD8929]
MTNRVKGDEAGTFFIASIGLTLATWRLSFTLGAYGEVLYTDFVTIWLVSLTALAAGIVIGKTVKVAAISPGGAPSCCCYLPLS